MLPWPSAVFMDVVVVVEFKNVHGNNHSDEVAKTLCACGGRRAVAGVEEVPTKSQYSRCVEYWCRVTKHHVTRMALLGNCPSWSCLLRKCVLSLIKDAVL